MTIPCKECQERVKDWEGSDRVCSFPDEGAFDPKGWNCALASAVRDICYEGQELPYWVDYQYCDDQKYATVNLAALAMITDADERLFGLALWVSWYKQRGRTDAMWLLDYEGEPVRPTAAQVRAIVSLARQALAQRAAERR